MSRSVFISTVLALGLAAAASARGDEVLLKNGDRLTGEVVRIAEGKLVLQSAAAGEVTIGVDDIRTFATDEPIEIHFRDGTVVKEKVVAAGEGQIGVAAGEVLAAQTFSLADIKDVNPPPVVVRWKGSVNAGVTVTRGNTDTQSAYLRAAAVRRGEPDRNRAAGAYGGSRQRSTATNRYNTTERRMQGGIQYDYFISDRAFVWGNTRAEKDGVAALDLRLIAGAGGGYQWIESDAQNLSTELGVTWFSEAFSNATPNNDSITARAAGHYDRQLHEAVKFLGDVEWFPGIENSDDQYVTASAALRSSLVKNLFAEARVEWDYDNTPAKGAERIDVRYILSLGWAF